MLTIKVNNKQIAIEKKNGKYVFNGWITVKKDHSNEEETGRHLFVKDGETPKEAMKRAWGVDLDKKKQETPEKKQERRPREDWQEEAEKLGGHATAVKVGIEKILPHIYTRKELSQNIADEELIEEIMKAYRTLRPEAWRIGKLEKAGNLFFRPGQEGEWEPKSHGRVKEAFGKKTYTEQGRLKMAFTKEYEDRIKPDPDFEY